MNLSTIPSDPDLLIQKILAEPVFRGLQPLAPNWIDTILEWIGRHIAQLARLWASSLAKSDDAIVIDMLILFAIVGIALFGIELVLLTPRRAGTDPHPSESSEAVSSEARMAAAQTAAADGDYTRAIALLFAASLAFFHERGIVTYDATRTAGEYERTLRLVRPSMLTPFRTIARSFVQVAFAGAGATAAQFDEARRALGAMADA